MRPRNQGRRSRRGRRLAGGRRREDGRPLGGPNGGVWVLITGPQGFERTGLLEIVGLGVFVGSRPTHNERAGPNKLSELVEQSEIHLH